MLTRTPRLRRPRPGTITGSLVDLVVAERLLVGLLIVFTVATLAPAGGVPAVVAPEARVALETTRFLVTFATAGLLGGLGGGGNHRSGFIAALIVLGLTDLWFGVIPNVVDVPGLSDRSTALPWVTARQIAGVLFVLVGLEWPRWPTARLVGAAVGVFTLLELTVLTTISPLGPGRLESTVAPPVSATQLVLEVVPLVLFAVGAALARRLYDRDGQPVDRWLASALMVGAFTQIHEAAFPVGLGPVISTADLLRAGSTLLLLTGAALQVVQLRRDRTRALELSQADLRELREVSNRLQDYVAQEASFRSVVTHELATPVATISAYAHVLNAGDLTPPADAAARTIEAEARRLRVLIERMDELTGLDADALNVEPRPLSVVPLLHEAAAFGRALPGNHPVTVRAEDQVLDVDPTRVSQTLRNLIANGARYTPNGTVIQLAGRVVSLPDAPPVYEITVSDDGPGFGVQDADELFQKYRRGPAATQVDGTGLGLWIVREVMRAHDGTVTIVDPAGPGARVRLCFPLPRPTGNQRT